MKGDEGDNYGRLLECGEVNMLFSYTSGEEYGYQLIHFWFEGKNMITSMRSHRENDSISQVGQPETPTPHIEEQHDSALMTF
eukprot:4721556-Amphidinium_carterae.3